MVEGELFRHRLPRQGAVWVRRYGLLASKHFPSFPLDRQHHRCEIEKAEGS